MPTASSSKIPIATETCKYHVFLSFRGEDIRKNFLGHIYRELDRKLIRTFKDDVKLERGESISPALLGAIEESRCAIVILSENYASSGWCLDELVKILECRELRKLKVVPIFYKVDPSDIKKNRGSFAKAIARHEKTASRKKLEKWKDALKEVSTIAGYDSRDRDEATLIDEVVQFISKELLRTSPSGTPELVGMDFHVEKMKSLLRIGFDGVLMVGIWGMGGIGKSTIARAVYDQLSDQFEGCCFLEDVKDKPSSQMQKELLSEILSDKSLKMPTLTMVNERLRYSKVLIVLDDVGDLEQLENLAGNQNWFGPSSRIIITTRDRGLLDAHRVKVIYEVQKLDHDQSFELFRSHAFKDKHPGRKLLELSERVISYTNGLPLALKVLGAFLYNKTILHWQDALNKLETIPNGNVQKVLKISYDGLDDDDVRDIFLDIACFFKLEHKDVVIAFLKSSGYYVDIGLKILCDKSLITISDNRLRMHELIREMGKEVARQESPRAPGRRRRLCIPEDACRVLVKKTGTDVVEGISLDVSRIKEANVSSEAFARMCNLRLLQIYYSQYYRGYNKDGRLRFPQGLDYLPDELRFLFWHAYPLKYLPSNFDPRNLVKIHMHYSNVEQLWKEDQEFQLPNLKQIDLSYSENLIELPDFSCTPNVESILLYWCTGLKKSPASFSNLSALRTLALSGCPNITEFPNVCRNVEELQLMDTLIEEVPSSVGHISSLRRLVLAECTRLKSLHANICKLKHIKELSLSDCTSLESFPEISESMDQLADLDLTKTAIKGFHSSIELLSGLTNLRLSGCENLTHLPTSLCNLKLLEELDLDGCLNLTALPENLGNLKSLTTLKASGISLQTIPEDIGRLSSLVELNLSGNDFDTIPESIKNFPFLKRLDLSRCKNLHSLSDLPLCLVLLFAYGCTSLETIGRFEQHCNLKKLDLSYCRSLRSLPPLPLRMEHLNVCDCTSLETVCSSEELLNLENFKPSGDEKFVYVNCFKLSQEACDSILVNAYRRIQLTASSMLKQYHQPSIIVCVPGNEIPEWFRYQNPGSSITIQLPQSNRKILGFSVCIVLAFKSYDEWRYFTVDCEYRFKTNQGVVYDFSCQLSCWDYHPSKWNDAKIDQDHVLLCYDHQFSDLPCIGDDDGIDGSDEDYYSKASFDFYFEADDPASDCYVVTKCGVDILYADIVENENPLSSPCDTVGSPLIRGTNDQDSRLEVIENDTEIENGGSEDSLRANMEEEEPSFKRFWCFCFNCLPFW